MDAAADYSLAPTVYVSLLLFLWVLLLKFESHDTVPWNASLVLCVRRSIFLYMNDFSCCTGTCLRDICSAGAR